MYLIRPIQLSDLNAFVAMAQSASIGMTNMPKNPNLLLKRIERSLAGNEHIFVLENWETKTVEGVSGLYLQSALEYYYQIEKITLPRFHPAVCKEMTLLRPMTVHKGPSEICSLFIAHSARSQGLGRLLSLSRFLFIATFPDRFEESVTALMRGYFDAAHRSPFWEGVGHKFLAIDFPTLLRLREDSAEFVSNIVPQYPLYAPLLSHEAQSAIGQVHPHTLPALKMLQQEGFEPTGKIDFFEGGPQIAAKTSSIRTIRNSRLAKVAAITSGSSGTPVLISPALISNERLDFRAVQSPLQIEGTEATLTPEVALALQVEKGETIRYVSPS